MTINEVEFNNKYPKRVAIESDFKVNALLSRNSDEGEVKFRLLEYMGRSQFNSVHEDNPGIDIIVDASDAKSYNFIAENGIQYFKDLKEINAVKDNNNEQSFER
jgi:hypothetical protein